MSKIQEILSIYNDVDEEEENTQLKDNIDTNNKTENFTINSQNIKELNDSIDNNKFFKITIDENKEELESNSNSNPTETNSIILCEICLDKEKKYKCPRCSIFTCSLECCKYHKIKNSCNGKRDKTKYVAIKDFKDENLRSDYHFLEDILQTKGSAKRTFEINTAGERGTKFSKSKRQKNQHLELVSQANQNLSNYSKGVRNLVNLARVRGTRILLLPNGMSKRSKNKSYINTKTKTIFWHLCLAFIVKDTFDMSELIKHESAGGEVVEVTSSSDSIRTIESSIVSFSISSINEDILISDLIEKIFDSLGDGTLIKQILRKLSKIRQNLSLFIRVIPSPSNNPIFRPISKTDTLKEALAGSTFVEFPTIFFCQDFQANKFRLLVAPIETIDEENFLKRKINDIPSNSGTKKVKFLENNDEEEVENDDENETVPEENCGAEEEEEDDQEEDEEEDAIEFMKQLMELEGKDIKDLQSIIESAEAD